MSQHPLNLALRFLLEIAASVAIGYWGWHQAEGPLCYAPAILHYVVSYDRILWLLQQG